MTPTYYLAGPMTGKPNDNRDQFNSAAEWLTGLGYRVINPASHHIAGGSWPAYLALAIHTIYERKPDGIALLPGWSESRGAQLEFHVMLKLRKPAWRLIPRTDGMWAMVSYDNENTRGIG
jgi:hypothetical protein